LKQHKALVWTIVGVTAAAVGGFLGVRFHQWRPRSVTIEGAVIRKDDDVRKELPIADVQITATDGVTSTTAQSDGSGFYRVTFPEAVLPNQHLDITFRHPEYQPFQFNLTTGVRLSTHDLFIAAMTPLVQEPLKPSTKTSESAVQNIRVRYTVNLQTDQSVGSAVRTFQVVNKGNVPCNGQQPCSPNGVWKAAQGSVSLDAGPEDEFRNVRASCIAGPCPFTRLDSSGFANGGRTIKASAIGWSDTTTFLVEAEVFRTAMTSNVRELFPVLFGQALHFTLPPTEEGVTIEADVNGQPMVFPLGPDLFLSWATCTTRSSPEPEKTTVYRCELKPGYHF
jgi:hypothetical protein